MSTTPPQEAFTAGWKRAQPSMDTITAEGTVPMIPPTDMPISMAVMDAGEVR